MILVLVGRSGSGKSAVAGKLKEKYGYADVRTCTTRNPRENEPEDAYHFMSMEQFRKNLANDEFVEFDRYNGNYYGTLKSSLRGTEKKVIVMTPEGALNVKKEFPDTFVVCIATDIKTSVIRAVTREKELTPEKLVKISERGCQDYYLFDNDFLIHNFNVDLILENPADADLDAVAKEAVKAHENFIKQKRR